MGRLRRLGWSLVAATLLAFGPAQVKADELNRLYEQILRNPADSSLNLRFAQLAEERGSLRWALAAYERIQLNDPENFAAKVGMMRIRRILQPSFTLVTAELGAAFESNPLYYLPGPKNELQGFGALSLRDERNLFGTRWRTLAAGGVTVHQKDGDLNYGYAGADTGPVIDLFPGLSVHTAIGGAASFFDKRFYYSEAAASATFESVLEGAYRAVRMRLAYRSYDDFFPSHEGFYFDIRGRFAQPDVLGPGSVAILSPWVLWSNISGIVANALVTEIQPGAYFEVGGRIEVYKPITSWMTLGGSFAISRRDYRHDIVVPTTDTRRDTLFAPGVTLLFPHLFAYLTDLKFDYRFLRQNSNDPTKEFDDHLVTVSVIKRFDPNLAKFTP